MREQEGEGARGRRREMREEEGGGEGGEEREEGRSGE